MQVRVVHEDRRHRRTGLDHAEHGRGERGVAGETGQDLGEAARTEALEPSDETDARALEPLPSVPPPGGRAEERPGLVHHEGGEQVAGGIPGTDEAGWGCDGGQGRRRESYSTPSWERMWNSTRRFFARPLLVTFGAMGFVSP